MTPERLRIITRFGVTPEEFAARKAKAHAARERKRDLAWQWRLKILAYAKDHYDHETSAKFGVSRQTIIKWRTWQRHHGDAVLRLQ